MTGYTRQKAAQIVNGSDADADDVAAEFNQVESAFNSVTGHKHDGTSAEGAPIEEIGPNQEYVATVNSLSPKTTATYDLGTASLRWKDAYYSGTVTAGTFTGNVTGSVTGNVTGNADTATALETARTINGTSFDGTGNITTSNWGTSRTLTIGDTGKAVDGSVNVSYTLGEIGVNDSTLTLATSGIATGSQSWTSNQGTNATFTVNVPATNLGSSGTGDTRTITSSTGTNTSITYSAADVGAPPNARTITAGDGLSGGGDLSANRTVAVDGTVVRTSRTLTAGTGLTGGGDLSSNRTVSADIASQAEAETGTDNTKLMTPLRVAQSIVENVPAQTELTQTQVEDDTDTTFGLVSGERLEQQTKSSFNVSGSAPKYACRAWVNFNGTGTVSIRASGNVSSVTDNGTGRYTINFATDMPDSDYAWAGSAKSNNSGTTVRAVVHTNTTMTQTASALPLIVTMGENATFGADSSVVCVSVFR